MRNVVYIIAIVGLSSAATYVAIRPSLTSSKLEAMQMKAVAVERKKQLLGYTEYTKYLAVGKQFLSGNAKLIAATVDREEVLTQATERSVLGLLFVGVVLVTYRAEYSFGFDLRPDQYEIRATAKGIEVQLQRPTLVAIPATTVLKHKVLAGSLLTDEQDAVLKLYEVTPERVKAQGLEMASEPAIVALCEKNLAMLLRDFLAKQPGVSIVPTISIVYASPAVKA